MMMFRRARAYPMQDLRELDQLLPLQEEATHESGEPHR